jgi:hypothetical protein
MKKYETPDYKLSATQDYREDSGGDQQHIWQARDMARVFTPDEHVEGLRLLSHSRSRRSSLIELQPRNVQLHPSVDDEVSAHVSKAAISR